MTNKEKIILLKEKLLYQQDQFSNLNSQQKEKLLQIITEAEKKIASDMSLNESEKK